MLFLSMIINIPFRFIFFLYFLVILFHSTCSTMEMPKISLNADPCEICEKISNKLVEAYKSTSGSGFGGGNTDWEEKKLKGYEKSETRLIEIMEKACAKTEPFCNIFLEKHEAAIEEWYQTSSAESLENFFEWLCIDTAKDCCPEGTFGKNCRKCQYGDNGLVCSGNGECDGDGTRSGNGRCRCNPPYKGTNCSYCLNGYTRSVNEKNQVNCTDIDECRANIFISPCHLYKCNNTEGSYECYGEPFYRQLPKMSTLAVLLVTASIFMFKEMYGLTSLTLLIASILMILFMKNIL